MTELLQFADPDTGIIILNAVPGEYDSDYSLLLHSNHTFELSAGGPLIIYNYLEGTYELDSRKITFHYNYIKTSMVESPGGYDFRSGGRNINVTKTVKCRVKHRPERHCDGYSIYETQYIVRFKDCLFDLGPGSYIYRDLRLFYPDVEKVGNAK